MLRIYVGSKNLICFFFLVVVVIVAVAVAVAASSKFDCANLCRLSKQHNGK